MTEINFVVGYVKGNLYAIKRRGVGPTRSLDESPIITAFLAKDRV